MLVCRRYGTARCCVIPQGRKAPDMAQISVFPARTPRRSDGEATLGELLDDPVTHAVMRRDGVSRQSLLQILDGARSRLGNAAGHLPERCCA
jgi:hypothetical protein